jgi:iron complex transport system substrate-binding protein
MKIVSLLPAATEIVCALGLRESLVGRSHECDFPEDVAALPALTRARIDTSLPAARIDEEVRRIVEARLPLYMLDEARLAALAPDVVVTQGACEVCAISYEQVVASLRRTAFDARVVSLRPQRLPDVLSDVETVAEACGVPERGKTLASELRARLERVARTPVTPRRRVTVVEWLDPPMLAGHWVPDAIGAAGGLYLGAEAGAPSPYVSWDAVRALRPDAVVVAPCGFDLPRTKLEAEPLADTLRSLCPRVLLMDGNAYLNRPGPRIVEAIEKVATWLRDGTDEGILTDGEGRAQAALMQRPEGDVGVI